MKSKAAAMRLVMGLALALFTGCRNGALTIPGTSGSDVDLPAGHGVIGDCVATFFSEANDGIYFSTQRHHIDPRSKAIAIHAREPEGQFSWRLSGGNYQSSVPPAGIKAAPAMVIDRAVVQAIVTCFAASAGYYDLASARELEMAKIDGRWYRPYELPVAKGTSAKTTLFLLPDEGRIDMVRVASASGSRVVTARGYNDYWLKQANRYVPTKIDVFAGVPGAAEPARILQVNYKSFDVSE